MRRDDPEFLEFQRLRDQSRAMLAARYDIPPEQIFLGSAHPPEAPWRCLPPDCMEEEHPSWTPGPGPELDVLVLAALGWTDIAPRVAADGTRGASWGRPPGGGRRRPLPQVSTESGAAWEWVVEAIGGEYNWVLATRPADRPSGRPNWCVAWEGPERVHAIECRTMPCAASYAALAILRPHGPETGDPRVPATDSDTSTA
jgi:hypothetical protein